MTGNGAGAAPAAVESTFDGVPSIELRAGPYVATFLPSVGLLGASLTHEGLELVSLHGGVEGYRGGHTTGIPLLHPWANRLGRLTYEAGGTWVDIDPSWPVHLVDGLPIHGTMTAAQGWEVEAHLADASRALLQCRFPFGDDDLRLASFPFPHDLVVFAELGGTGLRLTTSIVPTGSVAVPVSFGWHPYLTLPGVARAQLSVDLPARDVLELDARMLPTGADRSVGAGTVLLGEGPMENALDDAYRLHDDAADRTFVLRGTDGDGVERAVSVAMGDGYTHAQAYAPRGRAFAALEPMTAPIDALVSGDHRWVAPGDRFDATFTISVPGEPLVPADEPAVPDPVVPDEPADPADPADPA